MERYTEKVDGIWSISCKYEEPPYPVVTQEVINRLAAYEDTGLEPEEIQKLKAEAANGQQMKNLLSRNGFRDLSEAQAWIEQMKKLESNIEYYGKAYETPFCPACGAPMTDEAVDMGMKRLEALKDGKGD